MTAKELLKPRFELVADFPNNDFGEVGTVLDKNWSKYPNDDETQKPLWSIADFPNLFRKLEWWEKRSAEQMPKRVSFIDNEDDIYEIEEWDMEMLVGWTDKKKREYCSLMTFSNKYGYIPVD